MMNRTSRHALAAVLLLFANATTRAAESAPLAEFEQVLKAGILEVWFPRTLDREHGGFFCDYDFEWKPAGRQPKSIVFQSRLTWLASQGVRRYPDDPRYLEAARHGFAFLRDVMWDREHGGWYWSRDRRGGESAEWGGVKHAYGIGFGIYACAAHYRATTDAEPLDLAKQGFAWLEKHAHDPKHGGYFEYFRRDGTPIHDAASNPLNAGVDAIGTRLGRKSMNAHIHLLEAFASLYEVWPDELVKTRLIETLEIVRDRITAPPGAMHQFFQPDWTPIPGPDSYGHDIETGYLLMEAAAAAGLKDDARTRAVAKSLVDHTIEIAWDDARGGFFEAGDVNGPVHDKRKVWWVQAEGLNALLLMARTYPDDPRGYRKLFERQWAYMKANVIDAKHGEWYENALDAGGSPEQNKASEWKAGYHGGRAMLNATEWLAEKKPE